jgi:hypothetical protein
MACIWGEIGVLACMIIQRIDSKGNSNSRYIAGKGISRR